MLSGIKAVGMFHLYGILTWLILIIPAGAVSYFSFLAVFQKRNPGQSALRNLKNPMDLQ